MPKLNALFLLLFIPVISIYAQSGNQAFSSQTQPLPYLQISNSISAPSNTEISQSLNSIERGMLTPQDIATVANTFAFLSRKDQNTFLLNLREKNKKLAETLIIYRNRLNQYVAEGTNLQPIIEAIFLHYVINTEEGISARNHNEPQDLFVEMSKYSQILGMEFSRSSNGRSFFKVNSKSEECYNCTGDSFNDLHSNGVTANRIRYGRDDVISSSVFDFNGTTKEYRLENAAILADLSHLSYFQPQFIKTQLAQWNYSSFSWIEGTKTDTQVFVAKKDNYQIVCFRGTESFTDALVDVWFKKVSADEGKGKVHAGFQSALDEIWTQLEKTLNKQTPIYVSGHSLGGALAQLTANRLTSNNYRVYGVYTFGSPRVGNLTFKKSYDVRLKDNTFLHINNRDVVATVPPEILGFMNLGGSERRFDSNHQITLKDTEGKTISTQEELEFDQLDTKKQLVIRNEMKEVSASIKASSEFLNTSAPNIPASAYGTEFDRGKIDDHKIDQYLFKLACAIVEREWQRLGISGR